MVNKTFNKIYHYKCSGCDVEWSHVLGDQTQCPDCGNWIYSHDSEEFSDEPGCEFCDLKIEASMNYCTSCGRIFDRVDDFDG